MRCYVDVGWGPLLALGAVFLGREANYGAPEPSGRQERDKSLADWSIWEGSLGTSTHKAMSQPRLPPVSKTSKGRLAPLPAAGA